jgi:hypothetical protein
MKVPVTIAWCNRCGCIAVTYDSAGTIVPVVGEPHTTECNEFESCVDFAPRKNVTLAELGDRARELGEPALMNAFAMLEIEKILAALRVIAPTAKAPRD